MQGVQGALAEDVVMGNGKRTNSQNRTVSVVGTVFPHCFSMTSEDQGGDELTVSLCPFSASSLTREGRMS